MKNNILDTIERNKALSEPFSWAQLAQQINDVHLTAYTGEALRSWYRRNRTITPTTKPPISIAKPFDETLTLELKQTLVLADLHCPYHDESFITEALRQKPEQIIIAGDLLDLDSLSRYSKAHNIARLETELEITGQMVLFLAQYAPVYITKGNHDARFFDKLDTPLSFARLINAALNGRTPKNPIKTTERDYVLVGDTFIVGHLDKFSTVAGKLAHGIAQKYNRHALVGHDHLSGVFTGDPNARYIGASIGCCADSSKFWYSERRMNSTPFMTKGYAYIWSIEDDFSLYNNNHDVYFNRVHGFNSFKVS